MNSLNPYDVLGIEPTVTWSNVKKAYKCMLIKTHPDKMGSAKYFMLVHEAYTEIQKQFKGKQKVSNERVQKQTYTTQDPEMIQPKKMRQFTADKFNQYFDEHRIDNNNPYSKSGYGNHMTDRLNYQEDISVAKTNYVYIPTNKIVRYKEPEFLPSSKMLENVQQLGIETIDDFSGGGGTDIMKAYCHTSGENIDTVKRFKSIDDLQNHRSSESLQMTRSEIAAQHKIEKQRLRLEQIRLSNLRSNDSNINNRYTQLHRRLH